MTTLSPSQFRLSFAFKSASLSATWVRTVGLGLLWLVSVSVGSVMLWNHVQTEGRLRTPPIQWPESSAIPHRTGTPMLVLFAHPKCPCTIATLRELDRLLARRTADVDVVVVFARPAGAGKDWFNSSAWTMASAIPGVATYIDNDNQETELFAALTSGQVCLYSGEGELLFHGGITPGRGHEGDSVGKSAILSLLSGEAAEACSPVYGCPLAAPQILKEGA